MKKIPKKWIIIGCLCITVLVFILIPKDAAANYESVLVQRGDISTYYSFSGNIIANDKENYSANKEVTIKEYKVKVGDTVKKGDILYVIDDVDYNIQLNQAKASLASAKNSYNLAVSNVESQINQAQSSYDLAQMNLEDAQKAVNRSYKLYELGGISLVELETSEKQYKQAQMNADNTFMSLSILKDSTGPINIANASNQVTIAQSSYDTTIKQLGDIEVVAKINGEVTFCSSNKKVSSGNTIISITNYDSLKATIKVDEYDISAIEMGKEADIYVSSLNTAIDGTISNLSKNANSMSGIAYFNAEVSIPKTDNILEGMSVEVQILNKQAQNILLLPLKAINFNDFNEPYVFIKSGNKVIEQSVKLGINDGVSVEVIDGLKENDTVYFTIAFRNMMMG